MTGEIYKKLIKNNFSQASSFYNQNAHIQREVTKKLINLLEENCSKSNVNYQRTLDLGCGSGFFLEYIRNHDNYGKIINYDISKQMLNISQKSNINSLSVQGDMDFLPFKKNSFDLIFSAFSIQWSQNINLLIKELFNLLENDGIMALSFPNILSLKQLRNISKKSGCDFFFIKMPRHADVKNYIKNCQFNFILSKQEQVYQKFSSPLGAIKNMKKIGANYSGNQKNIVSKKNIKNFANYRNNGNLFNSDWNISYFICIKNNVS